MQYGKTVARNDNMHLWFGRRARKKRISVVILLCFCTMFLRANSLARIYQIDDPLVMTIENLSIEAGTLSQSSAGPISGFDLLQQLDRIDRTQLSAAGGKQYDEAKYRVSTALSNPPINLSVVLSPELYGNTHESVKARDWFMGYTNRNPFLYGEAETILGGTVYGIFAYAYQKKFNESDFSGASYNLPHLNIMLETEVENSMPHTAFMGVSGKEFSVVAGRDTISWGSGNTGNLVLGDHAPYHDFIQATASNGTLRYTFLALPMNELDDEGAAVVPSSGGTNWNTLYHDTLSRIFLAHRLEADPFPWLRISLTEGTLFYTDRMDLRMFNPLMFLHNNQNFGEANNTLNMELEAALAPGWVLDAQLFIDQIQTTGEQQVLEPEIPPNAFAGLLGLRFRKPAANGYVSGYVEGVYTSPYVYLRTGDHTDNFELEYNLDLVQAVSMRDPESGVSFLGYSYGPDSIVSAAHLSFEHNNGFELFGDIRFVAQGKHGLAIDDKSQQVDLLPSSEINKLSPSGDDPAYSLITGFGGKFTLPDIPVRLHGQVHWLNRWNKADGHMTDMQIVIGASWTWDIL